MFSKAPIDVKITCVTKLWWNYGFNTEKLVHPSCSPLEGRASCWLVAVGGECPKWRGAGWFNQVTCNSLQRRGFRGIRQVLFTAMVEERPPERTVSKPYIFVVIQRQDCYGQNEDSFERKCFIFRKAQQPAGGAVIGRATYEVGLPLAVGGSASSHWKGVRFNIFKEGLICQVVVYSNPIQCKSLIWRPKSFVSQRFQTQYFPIKADFLPLNFKSA